MYKRQEYRYDLGMIGHDPHELAAFLSAVLQGYTRQSACLLYTSVMTDLEPRLMEMDLGPLFGLLFQSLFLSLIHILTEELKCTRQMEWVRRCINIHNRAEEIVLHEIIYPP